MKTRIEILDAYNDATKEARNIYYKAMDEARETSRETVDAATDTLEAAKRSARAICDMTIEASHVRRDGICAAALEACYDIITPAREVRDKALAELRDEAKEDDDGVQTAGSS